MSYPGVLGRTQLYYNQGFVFDGYRKTRTQAGAGACQQCTICYGMEMLAILTKQPAINLSAFFYWWMVNHPQDAFNVGFNSTNIFLPAESLWPWWLTYNKDFYTTGVTDSAQFALAASVRPFQDAWNDAPNHKMIEQSAFSYNGTIADRRAKAEAALNAGYTLSVFWPPNHQVCVWDYTASGNYGCGVGLDSRSFSEYPFEISWDILQPSFIMRRVAFTGAKPPPFTPPSWSFPPPAPKGTPVLNVSASLSGGNTPSGLITVTATYPGDVNNNSVTVTQQFNADGTPYVPPPPPPQLVNPSFELPVTSGYVYHPTGTGVAWTFSSNAGVQHNGSAWGASPAPYGAQSGFIQGQNTISQSITLKAGSYTLAFNAALRSYKNPTTLANQQATVMVDGASIGVAAPTTTAWQAFTLPFTIATDGTHTISFSGVVAGDTTIFIDNVGVQ